MNDKKVLKEYIAEVLKEGWFAREESEDRDAEDLKKKFGGFLSKIKSYFAGGGEFDDVIEDWIEDQEYYHDVIIPGSLKDSMRDFLKTKSQVVRKKVQGNPDRLENITRKMLDARFGKIIRDLSTQQSEDV